MRTLVQCVKTLFRPPRKIGSTRAIRTILTKHVAKHRPWVKPLVGGVSVCFGGGYMAYMCLDSTNQRLTRIYIGSVRRFGRGMTCGLIIAIDYKWTFLNFEEGTDEYVKELSLCHKRSADRLVQCCLKNGGLYVKLGQGIVSMDQIFPVEYTRTLAVLQDHALTRRSHEVDLLFREDFGLRPLEMFTEFDDSPLAAASLAQVHRATTRTGKQVAVKVQYIDLRDRFYGDVNSCHFICKAVQFIHPDYEFAWILQDLKGHLLQELDFEQEGDNMEECTWGLAHLEHVHVPLVHWPLSSKRVLTQEFINGVKINDIDGIQLLNLTLKDVGEKLVESFAEQIFKTGFIHADPHPGNVFVRRHGDLTAELVFLDHGLYERLEQRHMTSLGALYKAIVAKDEAKMAEHSRELGVDDYEVFCRILLQRPWRTLTAGGPAMTAEDRRHMQTQAQKHFDKINAVLKAMPRNMLLVIRNLNTIRSILSEHGNLVDIYTIMAKSAMRNGKDKA